MTNHWIDLKNSDCILIMGSNAAENHPISFKWVLKAQDAGGKVIHVDPRYTRTSTKADIYAPLRSGSDIAFLGGMINYILENDLIFKEYVVNSTNAAFIVGKDFGFKDGLFSGYNAETRKYDKGQWKFELDEKGAPKRDNIRRIACAHCDEDDQERLKLFCVQDYPGVRVDVCNTCNTYIKTLDYRELDGERSPALDDLATIALDILAQQQGYVRPTLYAWGF